ncbi:hypothetical protein BVRB_8g194880 [Beta vulgaris subsp. vulgaris]|nr:hypothetical protein BVRB_8g194880 [Beta vulgaris subsp. vulgaris]
MIFPIFLTFSLLISLSFANTVSNYCVGDLSLPSGPAGYACKDPAKVTVDDFVYSGLRVGANTTNLFKFGGNNAFTAQFPGLNGMGLSIVRVDMEVGGYFPIHTHRVPELFTLVEGTIVAGFIDSFNTPFYKTLNKGDIMIFPPTLIHFAINIGSTPVLAYATFSSENPGVQLIDTALFRNNMPSDLVQKITLLDPAQVTKLKNLFGGTN